MMIIIMIASDTDDDDLHHDDDRIMTPGQFDTMCKTGQFYIMYKNGQFDTTENLTPWTFHVRPCSPTLCPNGAQNPWPAGALRLSHNWQNIPNTNINIQVTHIPQLMAVYIQYKCISFTTPNHAPEGCTYTLHLTHISRLLAEYFQYLCIMSYSCLGYVLNRPRCQIVCFCKWC